MQAYIGKVQAISDSHWIGGLSTAVFFAGCDYNCPNCNVSDILKTKEEFWMDLRDVKKVIMQSQDSIKAVVFTGGEPCLQRQALLTLASYAKDLNLMTGLETNGSKPECIRSLIRLGLIDQISLDLKAPFEAEFFERATHSKTFFKPTEELMKDVKNTLRLLERHQDKIRVEIRTTITPSLVTRKEDLIQIAEIIEPIHCTWVLQRFNPREVQDENFRKLRSPSMGFLEDLRTHLQKKYPKLRLNLD